MIDNLTIIVINKLFHKATVIPKGDFRHGFFCCCQDFSACGICLCAIIFPCWSVYTSQNFINPHEGTVSYSITIASSSKSLKLAIAKCHMLVDGCSHNVAHATFWLSDIAMLLGFKSELAAIATVTTLKAAGCFFYLVCQLNLHVLTDFS